MRIGTIISKKEKKRKASYLQNNCLHLTTNVIWIIIYRSLWRVNLDHWLATESPRLGFFQKYTKYKLFSCHGSRQIPLVGAWNMDLYLLFFVNETKSRCEIFRPQD
jgi:hypothetical protein